MVLLHVGINKNTTTISTQCVWAKTVHRFCYTLRGGLLLLHSSYWSPFIVVLFSRLLNIAPLSMTCPVLLLCRLRFAVQRLFKLHAHAPIINGFPFLKVLSFVMNIIHCGCSRVLHFVINCKYHAIKCTWWWWSCDLVSLHYYQHPALQLLQPLNCSSLLRHLLQPHPTFLHHSPSLAHCEYALAMLWNDRTKMISNAISCNHFVTICWSGSDVVARQHPTPSSPTRHIQNGLKNTFCVRIQQRMTCCCLDSSGFRTKRPAALRCIQCQKWEL